VFSNVIETHKAKRNTSFCTEFYNVFFDIQKNLRIWNFMRYLGIILGTHLLCVIRYRYEDTKFKIFLLQSSNDRFVKFIYSWSSSVIKILVTNRTVSNYSSRFLFFLHGLELFYGISNAIIFFLSPPRIYFDLKFCPNIRVCNHKITSKFKVSDMTNTSLSKYRSFLKRKFSEFYFMQGIFWEFE
jgi:hypothetical protein